MPNCRLIFLFALLAFPLRPDAEDLSCDIREKERQKQAWLYELPAAAALPPLDMVVSAGAFIVLDEVTKAPNGCSVSFMAVAGDKKSIDLLANFEVSAGFSSHALLKGRLRRPDGTTAELQASDIKCQAITSDSRGYNVGRENEAKGYVAHFQDVTPGTIVQTQVLYSCSMPEFLDGWSGTQGGLTWSQSRGGELRHYPAALLRYGFVIAKNITPAVQVEPADAKFSFAEIAIKNDMKLAQASFKRPAWVAEAYSPDASDLSPRLHFSFDYPGNHKYDWNELINIWGSDVLLRSQSSGSARTAFEQAVPLPQGATPRQYSDRLNLFLRDQISNREGGAQPPYQIIANSKTASQLEKIEAMLAVLASKGFTAFPVLTRDYSAHPLDRAIPTLQWFNNFLVAVELPGGRIYYDPYRRIPSGELPVRIQGAEAILIRDRKTWEWLMLPVSAIPDNRVKIEARFTKLQGDGGSGTMKLVLTGSQASQFRDDAQSLSPAALTSFVQRQLDEMAQPGISFSEIMIAGLINPDAPLEISTAFTAAGISKKLGKNSFLNAGIAHPGPSAGDFVAETRAHPISFRIPRLYDLTIILPGDRIVMDAPPAPVSLTGPGLEYRREITRSGETVSVHRTLSAEGVFPNSRYGEIRAFMQKVAAADNEPLILKAAAD